MRAFQAIIRTFKSIYSSLSSRKINQSCELTVATQQKRYYASVEALETFSASINTPFEHLDIGEIHLLERCWNQDLVSLLEACLTKDCDIEERY